MTAILQNYDGTRAGAERVEFWAAGVLGFMPPAVLYFRSRLPALASVVSVRHRAIGLAALVAIHIAAQPEDKESGQSPTTDTEPTSLEVWLRKCVDT